MKRKRREVCPSPILDEGPKRTKVQAQRKFAQGSNVNSPVITPVKEFERADRSSLDLSSEPVELLPIRRPNTEDFLTFLCFRGTPLLPPNLNFFNTASIVDTNGQVHEIKSESPKNGPIDTSAITKGGSGPSDRPFIAFGVRKRADPIVISKQMEKKRRHALALQALRRKYQEQKMAKIRAVTISKLSEKPTSRSLVRSNSINKIEKIQQNSNAKPTIAKNKVKVISSKHINVNVNTKSVRTLNSKLKPKMCLRSFRGRFVQQELSFRAVKKQKASQKNIVMKKPLKKKDEQKKIAPSVSIAKKNKLVIKQKGQPLNNPDLSAGRVTRSNKIPLNVKSKIVRKKIIKRRIIIPVTSTLVKSRVLRSQALKCNKTVQSRLTRRCLDINGPSVILEKLPKRLIKKVTNKQINKESKIVQKPKIKKNSEEIIKDKKSPVHILKKIEKSAPLTTKIEQKVDKIIKVTKNSDRVLRTDSANLLSQEEINNSKEMKLVVVEYGEKVVRQNVDQKYDYRKVKKEVEKIKEIGDTQNLEKPKVIPILENKKELGNKEITKKTETICKLPDKDSLNSELLNEKKDAKLVEIEHMDQVDVKEQKMPQRPSRKTKEAAAIYMEILSHKLVNEKKADDDNISIDSFPELPNAKRMEQRENELKAKANISKNEKTTKSEKKVEKETSCIAEKEKNKRKGNEKTEIISDIELKKKLKLQPTRKTKIREQNIESAVHKIDPVISPTKISESGEDNKQSCETKETDHTINKQKDIKKIKLTSSCVQVKTEIKIETVKNEECNNQCEVILTKKVEKETEKTADIVKKEDIGKDKLNKLDIPDVKFSTNLSKVDKGILKQIIEISDTKVNKTVEKKHNNSDSSDLNKAKVIINKEDGIQKDEVVKQQSNEKIMTTNDSTDSDEFLVKIPKVNDSKVVKVPGKTKLQQIKLNSPECVEKIGEPKVQLKSVEKDKETKMLSDSDDECLANLSKANEAKLKEDLSLKRKTRLSLHKNKIESEFSEDSFHVDVKIPKKKQFTRSRSSKISTTSSKPKSLAKMNISSTNDDCDESLKTNIEAEMESNNKNLKNKSDNKVEVNFSDSDEEPLSKLTVIRKKEQKSAEKLKEDILRKQKALIESPPQKSKFKKISKCKEKVITETSKEGSTSVCKPKRECAKRPSNYLPMFSSSDDEEKFFHGFSVRNESNYSHSSLDFLSKDLGRRFGKEKVNMSKEQIEQWLKDSAMAGDDGKKEEELKFCQEIPTETSLNIETMIDTEKLKNSLLETRKTSENTQETTPEKPKNVDDPKCSIYKSPVDRKPIFKKEKAKISPAVGAFSVNNESSIYAFEEEIEDVVSTPFRRPSRRPSSTATSKSEDEFPKTEEQAKFRKPILKNENLKCEELRPKIKELELPTKQGPVVIGQKAIQRGPSRNIFGKVMKKTNSDQLDDIKYKIPSSPSASSSSSAKLYKRQNKHKAKHIEVCNPVKMADFPCNGPGELVEAPTFYPTEKEFQDPLEYIEKIGLKAEQFGICRIVPPNTFKPECKVSDDMRFTSYNQYVHKMLHRWGPNFKELMAIKKYLQTQNINLTQPPWIGGMEVDLPRLYQTVQGLGGLKEVIEKEKWSKVSDIMNIPKSAQDRVTKLDDIYCKYLLPYDTLSPHEREKLLDEVETEWAKRESKTLLKIQKSVNIDSGNPSDSESEDEVEECITKGRNMALNAFYRIARNTMSVWFKNSEPNAQEIEKEFWKHVVLRKNHICVHSGSIDSGSWGYGFAVSKNSPFARHAWNLKVLTNNSGSVLRSLGPVMGVTVPTLHVGMVFSACCWYRDPHSLPWIEYLHTGGNKIWYGIPNSVGDLFQKALTKLVPNYCRNQGIWLPSDTVMLPPSLLIETGVSLSRTVQEPGQFIVVFPKAFTSSISTGYVVSESVFFAPPSWLRTAQMTFDLLRNSCEPSMFSLERLYLSIVNDQRTTVDVLKQMIPIVSTISDREKQKRDIIRSLGVTNFEILPPPETPNARRKKKSQEEGDYECDVCRMNLYISILIEIKEDAIYCLDHGIEHIEKKSILPENCKLLFAYCEEDLESLVGKITASIEQKLQKKVFNKFSGMPTLLNKHN